MGRWTRFDSNQTRRQIGEEYQYLGATNALADHHRTGAIDPVHLEHRLRNIKTDRDNLAHGRLPSMWLALRHQPIALPCPTVGPLHSLKIRNGPSPVECPVKA